MSDRKKLIDGLNGINNVQGLSIYILGEEPPKLSPHIIVDKNTNSICFKLQDGDIEKEGINGCDVITILKAVFMILDNYSIKSRNPRQDFILQSLHKILETCDRHFNSDKLILGSSVALEKIIEKIDDDETKGQLQNILTTLRYWMIYQMIWGNYNKNLEKQSAFIKK